ncbi:MAG: host attachment protein [Alphaproteobacteria bacterium]|nr:host attachment protein [Alphaproteobacteria bacterium]
MKPVRTWIVVSDGGEARILLNEGPGRGVTEMEGMAFQADHPPNRDINADKPGRAFDSAGTGRHAKEPPSDPHRMEKKKFAGKISKILEAGLRKKNFDRLVLVASPAMLGDLREGLSSQLASLVAAEINKDLTHKNAAQLAQHLGSVLIL